jgi:hypothetical protein
LEDSLLISLSEKVTSTLVRRYVIRKRAGDGVIVKFAGKKGFAGMVINTLVITQPGFASQGDRTSLDQYHHQVPLYPKFTRKLTLGVSARVLRFQF